MEIKIKYPFIEQKDTLMIDEYDYGDWIPGARFEGAESHCPFDGLAGEADGEGYMLIKIIKKVPMPKPYTMKVFFTREWIDPDGKRFGNKMLRMKGEQAFSNMIKGYRYDYDLVDGGEE